MNTVNIKLYDIFRKDLKLPEDKARELVEVIDEAVKEGHRDGLAQAASKEDLAKAAGSLEAKIADSKADILKWMFGVFIALMLAIIGLYFKK